MEIRYWKQTMRCETEDFRDGHRGVGLLLKNKNIFTKSSNIVLVTIITIISKTRGFQDFFIAYLNHLPFWNPRIKYFSFKISSPSNLTAI